MKDAETWVFDLDNTLYPAEVDLFAQIDARMTDYVARALGLDAAAARAVQKDYYRDHGTTLAGLMALHDVDPQDFLHAVHDIDLTPLTPDPDLADAIARLPGRRFVFTNGSRAHADRVVEKLGLTGLFEDHFDIVAAGYHPKPRTEAFSRFLGAYGFDPRRAVMFEDLARNLAPAAELGFTTVLVRSGKDWSHEPAGARPAGPQDPLPDHIHHVTDSLKGFLRGIVEAR